MADESGGGSSGRFESFGKLVDEKLGGAIPRVEAELKRIIAYLNDEVVPQVRHESSQAIRVAAEQLRNLANRLDADSGKR
jgi:hypothetical protein